MKKACEVDEIHDFGIDVKNRTIYLNTLDDSDVDYKMSTQFIKNIDILSNQSAMPITVKILGSDGGDWSHGMAMYSAIKTSQCQINAYAYGRICSAMTVILQAADNRFLHKYTDFMLHSGSISLDQTSLSARSTLKWNNYSTKVMLDIYASRCKDGVFFTDRAYSQSRVRTYLDTKMKNEGDVWLTAQEAVDMGFADEVYGE
jgi:ATP-dependent protease ClpP protease subunit